MLQAIEIWCFSSIRESFVVLVTLAVSVIVWVIYAAVWVHICSLEWDKNPDWIEKYKAEMLRKLINQAKLQFIIVQGLTLVTYFFTSEDSTARFIILIFGSLGQGIIPEYWGGIIAQSVKKLEVERGTMQVFKFSSGRHIKVDHIDQPSLCLLFRDEFKSNRLHQDEVLWETREITQTEYAPWPLIAYTSSEKLILEVFI
jgi:hypothetical protein